MFKNDLVFGTPFKKNPIVTFIVTNLKLSLYTYKGAIHVIEGTSKPGKPSNFKSRFGLK